MISIRNIVKISGLMATAPQLKSSSNTPLKGKPRRMRAALRELWETRKPALTVIVVVLTVVGALAPFLRRAPNEPLKLPMLDVVIFGVAFLAVLGATVRLSFERAKQKDELQRIQAEKGVAVKPTPKLTQLENIVTPSLDLIRQQPRLVNRVQLDNYVQQCKLHGTGPHLDATCVFTIKGRNISPTTLLDLKFPIIGDNFAKFEELSPRYYDLLQDPQRQKPRKPQLRSTDDMYKALVLGFDNPGVGPYKDFHLELQYTWPATFNRHKDYWFIDNTGFEGNTEKLCIELDATAMEPVVVQAYSVDRETDERTPLGRVSSQTHGVYAFSPPVPHRDSFYVLLVAEA